jgi:hypothetical protein
MSSVAFIACYAGCPYAECHYVECHGTEVVAQLVEQLTVDPKLRV